MAEISKEKLENGVTVVVTDNSRPVAADRWYVKLLCTVILPVEDGMMKVYPGDSPQLHAMIRQHLGDHLTKDFVQERNFVDEQEKSEVVRELLARIEGNIKGYLASANFPALFLERSCDEARAACLAMIAQPAPDQSGEDDGPADFSACFKD